MILCCLRDERHFPVPSESHPVRVVVGGWRLAATQCHDGEVKLSINSLGFGRGSLVAIVTAGIDLAKSVFAVHGVDEAGKPALGSAR